MALLSHTLALVASVILAFPPGICCALPAKVAAASPTPAHACCRHLAARPNAPSQASGETQPGSSNPVCHLPDETPAPTASCCCARHLPPPVTAKAPASDFDVWTELPRGAQASDYLATTLGRQTGEPIYSGPRLHLLHCLWLQ